METDGRAGEDWTGKKLTNSMNGLDTGDMDSDDTGADLHPVRQSSSFALLQYTLFILVFLSAFKHYSTKYLKRVFNI